MENKAANFDRCYGFTHVIRKGDTLYKLSKQYNVKVSALILANPFVNIYNLQVGDEICIPRIRPVVIPVTPYPQSPYPRPGVMQPRRVGEDGEMDGETAPETENDGEMRDASGMRQRTPSYGNENWKETDEGERGESAGTNAYMRREQDRTDGMPEKQEMSDTDAYGGSVPDRNEGKMRTEQSPWTGNDRSWNQEGVRSEQKMGPDEMSYVRENEPAPQMAADSTSVETASCPCEEERIRAMTVDALLEEWDLSYAAFASCLELLKKM